MQDDIEFELSFRYPKKVKKVILYENEDTFPICPSCKMTMEREYQSYCDRCGQKLNWKYFNEAKVIVCTKWKEKTTNCYVGG